MAFTALASGDVDAKSPVSDDVMGLIKTNLDHLHDMLSDGATAPEDLVVNDVTLENGLVNGDLTVTGQLSASSFFRTEDILQLDSEVYP